MVFQPPELLENKSPLFKALSLWYLIRAALVNCMDFKVWVIPSNKELQPLRCLPKVTTDWVVEEGSYKY